MNFIHASMHLCILTALHLLPKDWILSVKHSSSVYWHIKIKLRVLLSYMDFLPLVFLCLHQGPLRWNGHWFSLFTSRPSPMEWSLIFFLYIKALSDGMVIDFLMFTSRPSPMEWSLIFFLYIKALSDGMVIDFLMFTSRPSPMEWSLIFFVYIKALSDGMVIDFFVTSWSSPLEWSSLFSSFDHDPFLWIGLVYACFVFSSFPLKPKRN